MTNEIIEHIIDVDDYVSVRLKIPKVLNAVEFAGLMEKSRKILNISLTPIANKSGPKPKQIGVKRTYVTYSPEIINEIKLCLDKHRYSYPNIAKRINKKFDINLTAKSINIKVKNLKKAGKW